jgi:RecA/RadA recombinase
VSYVGPEKAWDGKKSGEDKMSRFTELEVINGVGPAVAKRLREVGVPCVEALAFMTVRRLMYTAKIGEGTIEKVVKNAQAYLGFGTSMNGLEREQQWQRARRLTTGVDSLDERLLGGIDEGSLVDIYGPARGGKSQMCHQLAITAQLPEERGGFESGTIWLDSEGSFRPLTLRANAVRFGLDPDMALSQATVQRIINLRHLLETVWRLPQMVYESNSNLIIIDSLGKFFRDDALGLEEIRVSAQDLTEIITVLQGLTITMNCIVVVTNQVFNKMANYGGNPNAPVGGHLMAHASTHRFHIRRIRQDQRKLALEDNAGLPESDTDLRIGWGGFFGTEQELKVVNAAIVDYLGILGHNVGTTVGSSW